MSTDNPDLEFQRRLRLIMQQFGSVADLARAVGVSDNAIYKWVTGRGQPSMTSLVNLAKAAGVSVEWLATGAGARLKIRSASGAPTSEVRASAEDQTYAAVQSLRGKEPFASGQFVDYLKFSPSWIQRLLGTELHDLILVEVTSDSMSPGINEGDVVLADVRDRNFRSDGVYLLRNGGELAVKRLQRCPAGLVLIGNDNPAYESISVPEEKIEVVGRVRWVGGRI
jgi:phage repressor protein C with HTH and peptisase S24 domain